MRRRSASSTGQQGEPAIRDAEVQRDAPSLDRFQPGYGLITWLVLLHGWIDWSA